MAIPSLGAGQALAMPEHGQDARSTPDADLWHATARPPWS